MEDPESDIHIYRPPAIREWLVQKEGSRNLCLQVRWLLEQGSERVKEENRRRIDLLGGKRADEYVRCYESQEGIVVERRDLHAFSIIEKVMKRLLAVRGQLGATFHLRLSDREKGWWDVIVPTLEKMGFIVSAQTKDNPHGFYAQKGSFEEGPAPLQGYRMKSQKPLSIRATSIGQELLSQESAVPDLELKGLNAIPIYNMAIALFDGKRWTQTHLTPSSKIALQGVNTTAIQYGQTAFEGAVGMARFERLLENDELIEANQNANGEVVLFRIDENAKRLQRSCKAIGAPYPPLEQIKATIMEVVERNLAYVPSDGESKLYIRPYVMGTRGGAGANAAKEYIFAVEVFPFNAYMADKNGAIAVEGRLDLHRPQSGSDKEAPNYAPGFNDKVEAKGRKSSAGKDYSDLLYFDRTGNLQEASSCVAFLVKRGEDGRLMLVTPPTRAEEADPVRKKERHVLESITRKSIITIAQKLGISVEIRDISATEIPEAIGAFTAGTAAGITRIATLDIKTSAEDANPIKCQFNDEEANSFIGRLYNLLRKARMGQLTDDRLKGLNDEWTTKIPVTKDQLLS